MNELLARPLQGPYIFRERAVETVYAHVVLRQRVDAQRMSNLCGEFGAPSTQEEWEILLNGDESAAKSVRAKLAPLVKNSPVHAMFGSTLEHHLRVLAFFCAEWLGNPESRERQHACVAQAASVGEWLGAHTGY